MTANRLLRSTSVFRSGASARRWLLFFGGFACVAAADAAALGPEGAPLLPGLGAWCLALGWLWGTAWLAAAVAAGAATILLGLAGPDLAAWPPLAAFAVGALVLRVRAVAPPVRWNARGVVEGGCAAALAAVLGALPFAISAGGPGAVFDPLAGALAWLYPLAALYRLAEPRGFPAPPRNRWGWPTRAVDLAVLGACAFVAAALGGYAADGGWPLIGAALVVLVAALAGNLVGGATAALAAGLAGGFAEGGGSAAFGLELGNAVLVAVGLVAGGFASRTRERHEEAEHTVGRTRALLESLPIGLVEIDERGVIVQANPMAGAIIGCAAEELLGHPFERLGTAAARPMLAATTRAIRHRRQPEPRFTTAFLFRPDGSSRDVQVDWVYQTPPSGRRPLRVTALVTDVTDRHRALNALRDREHQLAERTDLLRVTMDALDHGLAAFSADDTLNEWNARFPEMLHLPSPLARPGTPAIAIFRFLATLGAFGVGVTEGQVRARMDRLIHPPNADDVPWIGGHHLRFSAHTMADGGWVWRIEDRTEDLRLRDIEQNRQKMEALGQLASGVAHELNNTLQPIFSLSELGLGQAEPESLAARCFARITDAAERAETIVRGVLTFARNAPVPEGDAPIVPALFDAVAFIRAGLPPQVRLEIAVDDGIPEGAAARLDRRELGQVLTNLVTNAADAMEQQGTIQINCRAEVLRYADATDAEADSRPALAVAVVDTGKGMDHALKQRIFEPFFTTKDEGHGTGLGLAVAFGIVRNWGGRIDVDSEPGLGSTFTVWIPLTDPEREGQNAHDPDR